MNVSKKKFCINLFIAAALALSFLYYGMGYFISRIEDSSAKIVADKKSIADINSKNMQLADSKKKYEDMKEKTQEAFAAVLDKDKTVDFITQAEKDAGENKVRLKIKTAGDKNGNAGDSFISSSNFEFIVGGDFNGMMHFLYGLENFKYDLDVGDIKISRGDFDEYNKDIMLMDFNVKLYQKNSQQ